MTGAPSTDDDRPGRRRRFVAGTRSSRLAAWQTDHILGRLRAAWPTVDWISRNVSTRGDEVEDRPLAEIGGRGAFTEAIEGLLIAGEIDFAVHSLKDLPVRSAPDLTVAAVVGPRNAGEVLVSRDGQSLDELPKGAVVGTSSLRRQAQLLRAKPHLVVKAIRGNVETRIAKVEQGAYDATLLAAAGVERLALDDRVTEVVDQELMLPAPGQGAIAVQCRANDSEMIALLDAIADRTLEACTCAERTFLAALGGGCSAPVAALAVESRAEAESGRLVERTGLRLRGRVVAADGSRAIDVDGRGDDPVELGIRLAGEALRLGAGDILRACSSSKGTGFLEGKRIVVTRPRAQVLELARALEAHGARVVIVPVIRIVSLAHNPSMEQALDRLDAFRWFVFASANAAEVFLAEATRAGGGGALAGRVAVVGPATAAAAAEAGVPADFVSRGKTGEELGRELPDVVNRSVLIPCAEQHGEELEQELERRGARVTTLPVYRTEPVPIDRDAIHELERGVDTVVFTSASTVDAFVRGVGDSTAIAAEIFAHAELACIGPSTARAVQRNGLRPHIVAKEHTASGLVAAIVQHQMETNNESSI